MSFPNRVISFHLCNTNGEYPGHSFHYNESETGAVKMNERSNILKVLECYIPGLLKSYMTALPRKKYLNICGPWHVNEIISEVRLINKLIILSQNLFNE